MRYNNPFILSTLLAVLPSFSLAQGGNGQQPIQAANAGDLVGTWVSQSQGVLTGPSFANPLNFSFNYGNITGVSYSFSKDGFFEEAWYRFNANGTNPNCIQGVIQWQHGTYSANQNGSITMNPFPTDGRQQVQDTCAPVSNIIQQINSTVYMSTWETRTDPVLGLELLLYQFNGVPVQPLYPYANPPIMLPTVTLTANVSTNGGTVSSAKKVVLAALPLTLLVMMGLVAGAAAVLL